MTDTPSPSAIPLLQQIGIRVRLLRKKAGLTQPELAEQTNITVRRLSLCEQGERHVSAGELFVLALRLGVPVSYFFEASNALAEVDAMLIEDREAERLVRAFNDVKSERVRRELFQLVKTTANSTIYSS